MSCLHLHGISYLSLDANQNTGVYMRNLQIRKMLNQTPKSNLMIHFAHCLLHVPRRRKRIGYHQLTIPTSSKVLLSTNHCEETVGLSFRSLERTSAQPKVSRAPGLQQAIQPSQELPPQTSRRQSSVTNKWAAVPNLGIDHQPDLLRDSRWHTIRIDRPHGENENQDNQAKNHREPGSLQLDNPPFSFDVDEEQNDQIGHFDGDGKEHDDYRRYEPLRLPRPRKIDAPDAFVRIASYGVELARVAVEFGDAEEGKHGRAPGCGHVGGFVASKGGDEPDELEDDDGEDEKKGGDYYEGYEEDVCG